VALLAQDGGRLARQARQAFRPVFTKDQYVAAVEGEFSDRTFAGYTEEPSAT